MRAVATVLTLVAVAAGGVVLALNRLDADTPVAERCAAVADGHAWYMSPTQADNAALIAATSLHRDLPARAATIGLATALQESKLVNIDYGDRDSVGLFQQRPSQGWGTVEQIMDPVYSTNAFYDGLVDVDGYEAMEVTVAAQAVQRSAFPDAYAQHEPRARAWASALTGYSPDSLTCDLAPVSATQAQGADSTTVAARVTRDLGDLPTRVSGPNATVDASSLVPHDRTRAAWAVAQWAVATAAETDVVAVAVADRVWERDGAQWSPSEDDDLPAGRVRITVASPADE